MPKHKSPRIPREIAIQSLTLFVGSLGFVAALAWNQAITEYIDVYIKPYFSKGSSVLSLFLYALTITVITVIVTLQLNHLTRLVKGPHRK